MIILCSSIDPSTLTIFAAVCSGLQQIAAVDLFINNVIRSSMDLSALTIFAVCSSTDLIVNTILRSMIEIILGDPHTMTVA